MSLSNKIEIPKPIIRLCLKGVAKIHLGKKEKFTLCQLWP